jgi:hypothetical protein
MPNFDGRGSRSGRPGRNRGSCGRNSNGGSFFTILWNIGRFLIASGILSTSIKKFISNRKNNKISNDEKEKIEKNSKVIEADWKEIK